MVGLSRLQKWAALAFDVKKKEGRLKVQELKVLYLFYFFKFFSICLKGCQGHETGAVRDSRRLEVLWEPDGFWALFPLRGGELRDRYDPSRTPRRKTHSKTAEREMDTDVLGYDSDQLTCAETDLKFLDRLGKREWVCD